MSTTKHIVSHILVVFVVASASVLCGAEHEKSVVVTMGGIGEDYEILGIVQAKHVRDLDKVNASLIKQAGRMGADYIIHTDYFEFQANLYGVGTAVKLKEEETAPTGDVSGNEPEAGPAPVEGP